ncbi:permease [Sorangium sp. So ce1153]|uniref:permease n=1 Tax=Sorangium sp. So ce1153 TaxID=3133333 RepID=UPI003F5F631D
MLALVVALSIAGLAAGPLLVALGRRRALPTSALDGLTLGLVPALVLSRHLPHAVEEIGAQAVLWAALGYGALWLTEHRRRGAGEVLGREIAFSALAVHGLLDGAGLALAAAAAAADRRADGAIFAVAVLAHRLPEGLSLAARFLPAWGWRQLAARLGLLGLLTLLGALLGQRFMQGLPHGSLEVFITFGLGVLLRLVVHTHEPPPRSRTARTASAVAFVSGLCVALALPSPESFFTRAHPPELAIADSLGPLFVATAPAMLAGLAAAGLLRALVPRRAAGGLRGGTAPPRAARGVLASPLPAGSRGVARLLLAGAPVAAVVAVGPGAPELGVGSALLSLRLLGLPLTAARVAGSALLAVLVALLVARAAGAPGSRSAPRGGGLAGSGVAPGARLRAAVAEAVGPALDRVAAWYLVGLVVAAVLEATLAPDAARALGAPADVVVSALVAVPLHVCAQGATAVAAVMIHKGLSAGAALAFLMAGPATNLAVLAALRRSLGARAAAAIALSSVGLAVAAGLAANALVPGAAVPELHALAARERAPVEWVCAAALGALLLSGFARLGPRAWLGNMAGASDKPSPGPAAPHACDAHARSCDAPGAPGPRVEHAHDAPGPRVEHAHDAPGPRVEHAHARVGAPHV